jgi:hypothetical protein
VHSPFFYKNNSIMELILRRETESSEWTQGKIYIDNVYQCFSLEDQSQIKKVMAETRIPAGRYEIKLRKDGTHHEKYAKLYPTMHKGMFWLQNVPGFQFILIHQGNTDDDSAGCILVGDKFSNGKIVAGTSSLAYIKLYKKVIPAFDRKERVFITVIDIHPPTTNG